MNWTGGRLNHHKNPRHRPRLRVRRYPSEDVVVEQQNGLQASDQLPSPHKTCDLKDNMFKSNQKSILPRDQDGTSSSFIDTTKIYSTDGGAETSAQLPTERPLPAHSSNTHTALSLSKQNLLAKPDWLNLSYARPVQLEFASAAEMSKVGRHKRRLVVNQSTSKRTRPDYGSQFTQPALTRRRRRPEPTITSSPKEEPLCNTSPSLSTLTEVFPSSPPFSVASNNGWGRPISTPEPSQNGQTLHDPDRSSYILPSFLDPDTDLISLDRARDFTNFDEVQKEHRKARNFMQQDLSMGRHGNIKSKCHITSEMAATVSSCSVSSDSPFTKPELPAFFSASRGQSIDHSFFCDMASAEVTSPQSSEPVVLHSTHLKARKRVRSSNHNLNPPKRFKLDDTSSEGSLEQQGVEVKDFATSSPTHRVLSRSSTDAKPVRKSGVRHSAADTFCDSRETDSRLLKPSSSSRFGSPIKPRQFCLDTEFDNPQPIEHDLPSSYRTQLGQSISAIRHSMTIPILSPELFLDTDRSKESRTGYSTLGSQAVHLRPFPPKYFDLAPESASSRLKSSSPVHSVWKPFSLASDDSKFSL